MKKIPHVCGRRRWRLFHLRWYTSLAAVSIALQAAPPVSIAAMEAAALAKDWKQVAALARSGVAAEPRNSYVHYWLGIALWEMDQPSDSIRSLWKAGALGLDDSEYHTTLGRAYYGIHQFLLFRTEMEIASQRNPSDPRPLFQIGQYLESIVSDYVQALRYYRQAADLAPDDGRTVYSIGYCLERLGELDQARDQYQSAVRLLEEKHERFSWPSQRLAQLLLKDDPQAAVRWSRQAVALEPQLAVNHYVLAKACIQTAEIRQALEALLEAVRLDPRDASAHYLLSTVYARLQQTEAARRERLEFARLKEVYGAP